MFGQSIKSLTRSHTSFWFCEHNISGLVGSFLTDFGFSICSTLNHLVLGALQFLTPFFFCAFNPPFLLSLQHWFQFPSCLLTPIPLWAWQLGMLAQRHTMCSRSLISKSSRLSVTLHETQKDQQIWRVAIRRLGANETKKIYIYVYIYNEPRSELNALAVVYMDI